MQRTGKCEKKYAVSHMRGAVMCTLEVEREWNERAAPRLQRRVDDCAERRGAGCAAHTRQARKARSKRHKAEEQ
jgi:hypothetical protein